MTVDYNYLKENGFILYEIISGSRLYGTNKPTSDFDKRYVYALPIEYILGMRGKYVEMYFGRGKISIFSVSYAI